MVMYVGHAEPIYSTHSLIILHKYFPFLEWYYISGFKKENCISILEKFLMVNY